MQRTFTLQLVKRVNPMLRWVGPDGHTNQDRKVAGAEPGDVHLVRHRGMVGEGLLGGWRWADSYTGQLIDSLYYPTVTIAANHATRARSEALRRWQRYLLEHRDMIVR